MRPDHPSDPALSFIDLPSGRMAYRDEGEQSGIPIVAIHGLPGSNRDFRWLAPAVTPRRFIAMDLPGFGETPVDTGPDIDPVSRADLVADFIRALDLGPVVLAGHSMGGVVATAVVDRHPALVEHLLLIASPGLRPHDALRRAPTRIVSSILRSKLGARIMAHPMRRAFRTAGFRGDYTDAALARTILCVDAIDIPAHANRLRRLTLPTTIVWCQDDPLVEPEIGHELDRALPEGGRLFFPDGGHNPQKHHAVEIAAAVR